MRHLAITLIIFLLCACGDGATGGGDSSCYGSFMSDGDNCTLRVDCEDGRWWRVGYVSNGTGKTTCSSDSTKDLTMDGGVGCKVYKNMETFAWFASGVCWDSEEGLPSEVFE